MSYITGPDPEPKPGWKERLKEGEVNITAVENFNKANHVGYFMSVVSASVYGGVMDQHELFGLLPTSGVEVLVVLAEKDRIIDPDDIFFDGNKAGYSGAVNGDHFRIRILSNR